MIRFPIQRLIATFTAGLATVIIGILAAAGAAAAQTDAGALRVLVVDESRAVVPGAAIEVRNTATNALLTAISDGSGYAQFTPLPRGIYVVKVTLPGFQTVDVTNVRVDVNERRFLPVTLVIATATETVEVVSRTATLKTEEGSLGQVIKGDVAVELPLAGRRYTELALLVPGTSNSTMTVETRGPGWFVANGNYHTQNNFVLDGFDNNQGTQNAQSLSAQVVQPSPDAIGEFKVQTNSFSAEFGRSAGAVVNVSLKSGTNAARGSAFYYNRDKSLAVDLVAFESDRRPEGRTGLAPEWRHAGWASRPRQGVLLRIVRGLPPELLEHVPRHRADCGAARGRVQFGDP